MKQNRKCVARVRWRSARPNTRFTACIMATTGLAPRFAEIKDDIINVFRLNIRSSSAQF